MSRSVIPPRTMRDVSRELRLPTPRRALVIQARATVGKLKRLSTRPVAGAPPAFSPGLFQKPRNWRFQTKPEFKKLHGPLIDVFDEADEVLIVIDLSGFAPGDLSLSLTAEKYIVRARRGREEFYEEIALPAEVDLEQCVEKYRNGILEITLPRRNRDPSSQGDP